MTQKEQLDLLHGSLKAASGAAIQRYKIGYYSDGWGERSSTPSGIPDASGAWVRYEDHVAALASTPGAARSTAPDWDEVFDCAVAAYNTEIFSKDNLRWCFQSRTQKIERTCNWTANELMAFALGIAALYAPQFSEKRDATDD